MLGYNMTNIKRKHIPELRRRLGIVFQDFQLLTDRTVHANLSFVLRATGWTNKATIKARIEEVLDQVGMTGKGYKNAQRAIGWRATTHCYRPCHPEPGRTLFWPTSRRVTWTPKQGAKL